MEKILLLSLFSLLGSAPIHSQIFHQGEYPSISLKGEYQGEYYILRVESKGPGTYSMLLEVYSADHYGGPTKRVVTVAGPGEILRLRREGPAGVGGVRYRYWLADGIADGHRDTNFVYRLPYSVHKNAVRAWYTHNINDKIKIMARRGKQYPFIGMLFRMDKGDTVYAARKGKVIRIEDNYDTSNHPELSFSSERNQMMVLHEDGTTAYYSGIEKEGFLVRQGDVVYPDTPIAIVGSFDGTNYGFYFNVGYPALTGEDDQPWGRRYYKPVFATEEGNNTLKDNSINTAKVSDELITCEMSHREKKNYEKNHPRIQVNK